MDWKKHILTLLNAGMTRDQIAAAMGVTTNAVREILAGRTKSPRADAAIRLLSIRPDIFGGFSAAHCAAPSLPTPECAGVAG